MKKQTAYIIKLMPKKIEKEIRKDIRYNFKNILGAYPRYFNKDVNNTLYILNQENCGRDLLMDMNNLILEDVIFREAGVVLDNICNLWYALYGFHKSDIEW